MIGAAACVHTWATCSPVPRRVALVIVHFFCFCSFLWGSISHSLVHSQPPWIIWTNAALSNARLCAIEFTEHWLYKPPPGSLFTGNYGDGSEEQIRSSVIWLWGENDMAAKEFLWDDVAIAVVQCCFVELRRIYVDLTALFHIILRLAT